MALHYAPARRKLPLNPAGRRRPPVHLLGVRPIHFAYVTVFVEGHTWLAENFETFTLRFPFRLAVNRSSALSSRSMPGPGPPGTFTRPPEIKEIGSWRISSRRELGTVHILKGQEIRQGCG